LLPVLRRSRHRRDLRFNFDGARHLSAGSLNFMKPLLDAYRFVNLLSIDIAIGAAVGAAFFARILDVRLYPQAYIVLALTVWIIYTADHLLDARRLNHPASTDRHLLHQRYFRILSILVVMAMVVVLTLVFFIRTQLIMACLCGLYLVVNRWLKYGKELMATILYAGGVLLPALSLNYNVTTEQWILIVEFVLIVIINMLLFARMDYRTDLLDRQPSFVTTAGPKVATKIIGGLFVVFGLMVLLTLSENYAAERLVLGAMAGVLLLIFLFPDFFSLEERYRLVGDAVFLLPAFLLAFG
jgi:hypothetical protein